MIFPAPDTATYAALSALVRAGRHMTAGEVADFVGRTPFTRIGLMKAVSALVARGIALRGSDMRCIPTTRAIEYIAKLEGDVEPAAIVAPSYRPPFKLMTASPFRTESPRGQKIERRSFLTASRAE